MFSLLIKYFAPFVIATDPVLEVLIRPNLFKSRANLSISALKAVT